MTEFPPPTWSPIQLRCGKCRHEWQDWMPRDVPAPVLVAAMKTFRCPACGSRRKVLIILPAHEPPP